MRTITTNVYQFSELSESAKQNAINKLSDINVFDGWYQFTYEDAEEIGLKITGFDLDRNRHATGRFINSAFDCAHLIIKNHGKTCETYKTSQKFLIEYKAANDEEIEEVEEEFLKGILEDYSIILQNESEYLQSEAAIIETIECNEYEFTEDGELI